MKNVRVQHLRYVARIVSRTKILKGNIFHQCIVVPKKTVGIRCNLFIGFGGHEHVLHSRKSVASCIEFLQEGRFLWELCARQARMVNKTVKEIENIRTLPVISENNV